MNQPLEETLRIEGGRVLATLIRLTGDFQLAEDSLQEAFVVALEQWSELPPNPGGWLTTTAPVGGGDPVKIRFTIWDTFDSSWDSTVVLDNFRWIASSGTVAVGTIPAPQ